jgi:hypothetical protein
MDHFLQADLSVLIRSVPIWITSGSPDIFPEWADGGPRSQSKSFAIDLVSAQRNVLMVGTVAATPTFPLLRTVPLSLWRRFATPSLLWRSRGREILLNTSM